MFGGLIALLDDVAALAKAAAASLDDVAAGAAKASTKALGVVIDDTAVTPQYFATIKPSRELPMVWRITKGSLRNKLFFILPAIIIVSLVFPPIFTPLLMLGGAYLSFEGAEKIWHKIHSKSHAHAHADNGHKEYAEGSHTECSADTYAVDNVQAAGDAEQLSYLAKETEDRLVKGAITTDLILSCEVMLVAFNSVLDQPLINRIMIMIGVALIVTVGVYGTVALIIKMDDVGMALARGRVGAVQKFGRLLVIAMPKVMTFITVVGTVAMLWVGGHLVIAGLADMGLPYVYNIGEHIAYAAACVPAVGSVLAWCAETIWAAICGFVIGSVIYAGVKRIEALMHKKNSR